VSEGQQSKTIPQLCFLTLEPGTLQTRSPRFDAFFQTLRELGYVGGQSTANDFRTSSPNVLRRKADIIVARVTLTSF